MKKTITTKRLGAAVSAHAIAYTIVPKDLAGHIYQVTLDIAAPEAEGQIVSLPAWIPGSYMVREFARNIVQIKASCEGKKVALKKLDKHTWQAAPCKGALRISYEVYAWDLSVRAAHLDQSHGFFNGTSVFLSVHGQEMNPHVVDIQRSEDIACKTWRVATSLPELKAKRYGFGTYVAANYDELIDHPVEMGDFALATFDAHGISHDFVVTGKVPNMDMERIIADVQKICETQIAFFEPRTKKAPMDRYVFMTMVVGEGYGGLEHRASTALICNRTDLPVKHQTEMSDGYRGFLGLCSHEYFHTWNVKRIKPAAFASYDLRHENYTSLLWVFEGFTSYYDDLMLVRAGVIDEGAYFKLVAKTINMVTRGSGRLKQSVAESSFDAWTKYYRQDENSPNAIVSYYTKGSLVALGLDLTIRAETAGKKSLDDVMRAMWQKFGRDFYERSLSGKQQGLGETEFESLVEQVTGVNVRRFLDKHVRGVEDVPLAALYADFAVQVNSGSASKKASLGVRVVREANDCKIANAHEGRAAHVAGLSPNDIIIAINGLRVTAADAADSLGTALGRYRVGETVQIHAFRRDELLTVQAKLQADDVPAVTLAVQASGKSASLLRPSYQKPGKK
ncbi:M61 family metallopeptidase [Undibacterium umbellatum]|uniref:M61 family metallopeptidase n=1 Tax=Undibacterium umbellatum TaxID=2762300 RepID=A0ABR6ZEL7_9BURK|nr:PDZ domain-containing protein [Undibacterium umbellatum]MBC3910192.1 M61 family metallopeptidase [Undibacterium umbellatum]